jgi:mono/diheme cytochrome c family protein
MFRAIYDSAWHHPILFWLAGAPVLVWLARAAGRAAPPGERWLAWAALVFQIEILLDAWLTAGTLNPVAGSALGGVLAIAFVVLGDLRFFLLLERFARPGVPLGSVLGVAAALSLVVPVASLPARSLWPGNVRALFLSYELAFAAFACAMRWWWLPRRVRGWEGRAGPAPSAAVVGWLERLCLFEIVQYVAWASADIVLLLGGEVGFLLRLVPNVLYYVAFVPFAWLTAPAELRARAGTSTGARARGVGVALVFLAPLAASCRADPPASGRAHGAVSATAAAPSASAGAAASAAAGVAASAARTATTPRGPTLDFLRDGKLAARLDRTELEARAGAETVRLHDPEYGRDKIYRAVPLAPALGAAFEAEPTALAREHFVLRALDGYTVSAEGAHLLEPGGFIAVADAEVAGWEPVGPARASPGPYYIVWREPSQRDGKKYPRPWQLASIEIAAFEAIFPHTIPAGEREGSPARRGFALFRADCLRCHAVNQEGGRVGPDLNVPQNILEYRPEPQIRAFIRDPRTFRYSSMPAHPDLRERDLDDIVAYLRAMKARKHDPLATSPASAPGR